jgi:chromatin remodeling complex protein RSC6
MNTQNCKFVNYIAEMDLAIKDLVKIHAKAEEAAKAEVKAEEAEVEAKAEAKAELAEEKARRLVAISPELASFLGKPIGTKMAHTDVIREINSYIRANKLHNGPQIIPDAKLNTLLKIKQGDKLTYSNLQKYVFTHLPTKVRVLSPRRIENASRPGTITAAWFEPVVVSPELAAFLGKPNGFKISRCDNTLEIIDYIGKNNLEQNIEGRLGRGICPDAKLKTLLMISDNDVPLTYFNLQWFLSPHFPEEDEISDDEFYRLVDLEPHQLISAFSPPPISFRDELPEFTGPYPPLQPRRREMAWLADICMKNPSRVNPIRVSTELTLFINCYGNSLKAIPGTGLCVSRANVYKDILDYIQRNKHDERTSLGIITGKINPCPYLKSLLCISESDPPLTYSNLGWFLSPHFPSETAEDLLWILEWKRDHCVPAEKKDTEPKAVISQGEYLDLVKSWED